MHSRKIDNLAEQEDVSQPEFSREGFWGDDVEDCPPSKETARARSREEIQLSRNAAHGNWKKGTPASLVP